LIQIFFKKISVFPIRHFVEFKYIGQLFGRAWH